jgi:predicted 3-demethylubiquinone-9 3-methyltransferase (glyoxalase superfamily)
MSTYSRHLHVYGRAEKAIDQYTSLFNHAEIEGILRFGADEAPDVEGKVKHAQFMIEGQTFMIMESAHDHNFEFSEAISLMVYCDTQDEIDDYWEKLKEGGDPNAQQCGWLKDRYGVSWQVAPRLLGEMIRKGTPEQVNRVTQIFLPMKKLDIATIQKAYDG